VANVSVESRQGKYLVVTFITEKLRTLNMIGKVVNANDGVARQETSNMIGKAVNANGVTNSMIGKVANVGDVVIRSTIGHLLKLPLIPLL